MSRVFRGTVVSATLVGAALLLSGNVPSSATTLSCSVIGTWDLVAVTRGGKALSSTNQQRKIVNGSHFMWINQATRRDTLPLRSLVDSLRYSRVNGGSGRYSLVGNAYTEHLDYFSDPSFLGKDFTATCRTVGDRWFHSYNASALGDTAAAEARVMYIEEWHRIK
jgi:hypothetical protein